MAAYAATALVWLPVALLRAASRGPEAHLRGGTSNIICEPSRDKLSAVHLNGDIA